MRLARNGTRPPPVASTGTFDVHAFIGSHGYSKAPWNWDRRLKTVRVIRGGDVQRVSGNMERHRAAFP
jgi:hypothetical protein